MAGGFGIALALTLLCLNLRPTLWGLGITARSFLELTPGERARIEVLYFIKDKTPPRSRFLSLSLSPLSIRYYALRPVVYAVKDVAALIYANHQELLKWHQLDRQLRPYLSRASYSDAELEELVELISPLQPDYVVMPTGTFDAENWVAGVVFENADSAIVETSRLKAPK